MRLVIELLQLKGSRTVADIYYLSKMYAVIQASAIGSDVLRAVSFPSEDSLSW
jgi:hypothetical protein